MHHNQKFELAARRRRRTALWIAVAIHLAILAIVALSTDTEKYLPEFAQELFSSSKQTDPEPIYP